MGDAQLTSTFVIISQKTDSFDNINLFSHNCGIILPSNKAAVHNKDKVFDVQINPSARVELIECF